MLFQPAVIREVSKGSSLFFIYFYMTKKKETKKKPKDTPNPNHKEDFMKVLGLAVKTPKAK